MRDRGLCMYGNRPHTVIYWLNDGGPPIPMTANFDTQPEAVAFADSCVAQDNLILRWIKIFRSDNESHICLRWENPTPFNPDSIRYERLDLIEEKPRRRWWTFF